ncbi:cytidylyltransferase domain-containing protein [Halomonas sp. KM-1]|uniref:acylneuraminate cytidylyltransferase family protein n=1 Tax=Halomonas sp. KM-1 TaxID=590061 RepID=UPI000289D240|nr:acylneuraminate cytidylyltransferase family protein [Halomonas sp. KM-1]
MNRNKVVDILAIIPARAGSKRLPKKNILPLAGKPLIQWTLDAVIESRVADLIAVTSDDKQVLEIASHNDKVTVIARPDFLAGDDAATIDVVAHTISYFKEQGVIARRVLLLQPTSPLRSAKDIIDAVSLHNENDEKSLVSISEAGHSSSLFGVLSERGVFIQSNMDEIRNGGVKEYRINGAIYINHIKNIIETGRMLDKEPLAFIMPKERGVDIDEWLDFKLCEIVIREGSNKAEGSSL